ncbi:substrate-binding and VWA domain-containing protein [Actinomadura rudentiformis]|uniref:substrate-binding and VWA domain-containing protein n=1 Tax=Actinomadura rudentiformis TaxID=359158 RepID=UPI00178C4BBE|nr:substrate-binding and VWA domain-containing protein [Actinomadura rudentiformis]
MRRPLVFGVALSIASSGLGACSDAPSGPCRTVVVAVAVGVAAPLRTAAARFQGTKVDGRCVSVRIEPRSPASVAETLAGTVEEPGAPPPDAWIPDSWLWVPLARSGSTGAAAVASVEPSLASSPIVWVLSASTARKFSAQGMKASWRSLMPGGIPDPRQRTDADAPRFVVPEPATSTTGMGPLLALHTLAGTGQRGLLNFATAMLALRTMTVKDPVAVHAAVGDTGRTTIGVASEQSLLENEAVGERSLVPVYPAEGTVVLDYPYVRVTHDRSQGKAADAFGRFLREPATRELLTDAGFRTPEGQAGSALDPKLGFTPAPPRRIQLPDSPTAVKIRDMWNRMRLGARLLDVLDVSPSMRQPVPGTSTSRLTALSRQIQQSLQLTPDFVEIGLWQFATRLDGTRDHREAVPIRAMGSVDNGVSQRDRLISAVARSKPIPGTYTGLYDTILAGFREVSRNYRPEVFNVVTVFTDGEESDPYNGMKLDELIRTLRQEYDPARPVSIIIGAYGDDIDTRPLQQIVNVTGGKVYLSKDPQQAQRIFGDLLVRMLCTGTQCPIT